MIVDVKVSGAFSQSFDFVCCTPLCAFVFDVFVYLTVCVCVYIMDVWCCHENDLDIYTSSLFSSLIFILYVTKLLSPKIHYA